MNCKTKTIILYICIFSCLYLGSIIVNAQQSNQFVLSSEGRIHWNKAMIYKEEVRKWEDYQLVVDELEALIENEEYPEAFLELAKIFDLGYTDSQIEKSEEYFNKYLSLCPENLSIVEDAQIQCETRRAIRKNS